MTQTYFTFLISLSIPTARVYLYLMVITPQKHLFISSTSSSLFKGVNPSHQLVKHFLQTIQPSGHGVITGSSKMSIHTGHLRWEISMFIYFRTLILILQISLENWAKTSFYSFQKIKWKWWKWGNVVNDVLW